MVSSWLYMCSAEACIAWCGAWSHGVRITCSTLLVATHASPVDNTVSGGEANQSASRVRIAATLGLVGLVGLRRCSIGFVASSKAFAPSVGWPLSARSDRM
eukprot:scaffold12308_cov58-Phaeocystis_antarctica.AAC.2